MSNLVNVVNSTSIAEWEYNDTDYILSIRYRTNTDTTYNYHNVLPPIVASIFTGSGSIGSRAHKLLKGYRYTIE